MSRRERIVIVKREIENGKNKTIFVHSRKTMIKNGICVQRQRQPAAARRCIILPCCARRQFQSNESAQKRFSTTQKKTDRFDSSSLRIFLFFLFFVILLFIIVSLRWHSLSSRRARALARDCVFHNYRWAAVQRQACVRIYALAHSLDYMAANRLHKKELRIIVKSNKITRQETRNRCENMRRFYISPSFIQQSNRIFRFTAGFHIILVSLRLRVVSVCAKCCEIKTKPDLFDRERVIVAIATSLTW